MAKSSSTIAPWLVYPLAAVGALAIYLHYWGRKLGSS
jgi:hypothetical protein